MKLFAVGLREAVLHPAAAGIGPRGARGGALDPALGAVAAQYLLGGNDIYLLCRGAASVTR